METTIALQHSVLL